MKKLITTKEEHEKPEYRKQIKSVQICWLSTTWWFTVCTAHALDGDLCEGESRETDRRASRKALNQLTVNEPNPAYDETHWATHGRDKLQEAAASQPARINVTGLAVRLLSWSTKKRRTEATRLRLPPPATITPTLHCSMTDVAYRQSTGWEWGVKSGTNHRGAIYAENHGWIRAVVRSVVGFR